MNQAAVKSDTQSIVAEEIFPHPPEALWKVLAEGALMECWLRPMPGHVDREAQRPQDHEGDSEKQKPGADLVQTARA